ncbi:serine/arginine-rich splicing factor RS2Z32-like [Ananas comosus]|uniref:Serine/arginine-rich splicing factor RS2Z32-like n=1 Tax=Ananas comosus TaxID=4615 RepID=A0A6P5F563_ANACO|nr:serine/arginine-rich splicing factor RS2Z32-like [Ananas comosus]
MAGSKDKGKKRPDGGSGGQSSFKKPSKHPRTQSWSRGTQRCTICGGGGHRAQQCRQRQGKCYNCGQEGHLSRDCPARAPPIPSVASTPVTPAHYGGAPPTASSAGRAMVPRQPEATKSAPSGRVFAALTQAKEPTETEDRHVLVELQESKSTWRVSGPGRDFLVCMECSSCPVRLGDWIMPIRMLVFKKLKDFDVILGMDWLSKYYATIHCRSKVITFREPGQEEFTYRAGSGGIHLSGL